MTAVLSILSAIETELKSTQLWSEQRPSDEALASSQPFCIDTLTLPQWIQFVLLERLKHMIKLDTPLPAQCGVAPMAEEYFKPTNDGQRLIALLNELDQVLSRQTTR
ncbi:MAG: pseudouridine synthase [Cellvibrionaceae bacterium]|nr:pseudouridine synthase [Cellvibrionaceae bacterium]|tara:strand:+ start:28 stop:348 length:321 start_codon:yes stop_codon:yes gene_type:complete